MPNTLRHTLLSLREMTITAGPLILLTLGLLGLAYWVLDPTPPKRVVLATGVPQGAYAEFGTRYAAQLAQFGVQVELRNTQGAAENLALLRDPDSGVDLAFVQGGADSEAEVNAEAHQLESLGSLFYEPVWLFYREASARERLNAGSLESLGQLAGWRVDIGPPGSGVPNLMRTLAEANGLQGAEVTLRQEPQTQAVMALLAGEIDTLVMASAPEALMVQMLLRTPGIKLFDFAQAEAYSRRFPFLSAVTLPRGVVDLARDEPAADVHLIAPTATLVARESVHPALVQLFVQAAQRIHGDAGWFQRKGQFPNTTSSERPLADEADRFYRNGAPFLQRYLPFWLANLVDRMWVALVSIIAILIPLSRVVPPLYEFRVRSRVFRWYGQLRAVEEAQGQRPQEELEKELDVIEKKLEAVNVPLSYADELYALRGHIALVRQRLRVAGGEPVQAQ